jgi:hypothetical protein
VITFNSNPCASNTICSIGSALLSYNFNSTAGSYHCEPASDYPAVQGYNYCGTRFKYRETLFSGSYPAECTSLGLSDPACMMEDGSYTECKCGLDSKMYCAPSASSTVFDNFWKQCSSNDYVVKAEFFQYYQTLYDYYVEYNSADVCEKSLIKEFNILEGAIPSNSFARGLVGMIGVVILIY